MRLKTAVVFLTLSLVCLISRVSFADSLTLSGVGGQNTDGVYVDPYLFTVTGPGGTSTLVDMSCLNFNREVSIGQSWNATPSASRPSVPRPSSTASPERTFLPTRTSITSTPPPLGTRN